MKSSLLVSMLLVGLLVVPLGADLRYTMRVEVRKSATRFPVPTGLAADVLQKLQQGILRAVAPDGSAESTFAANDEGVRIEYAQATQTLPKGGALLRLSDGSSIVLNPVERTYRRSARVQSLNRKSPSLAPEVTSRRTGEFSTIAGVRAERATFTLRLNLPAEMKRQFPPEMPGAFTLEGEAWITDQVKVPAVVGELMNPSLRALGLDRVVQDGFVVRQIIRGTLLGDHEVETIVSQIDASPIPPGLLKLPADYREVSPSGK